MDGGPSRTALAAAMYRAAHQRIDEGAIFADPWAVPILPAEAQQGLDRWAAVQQRQLMRGFISYRSHVSETRMAEAVERGTRQIVVVGAGLDTLGLRNPFPDAAVYEIDHPATQAWKRERLREIGATLGANVHFAPCDFEVEGLGEALARAGFDATKPGYFSWLGVVPYLTDAAIFATLGFIATVPGAEVVFDYSNPLDEMPPEWRQRAQLRADRAASIGEPFLASFNTEALKARLTAMGAAAVEDWGPRRIRGGEGDDVGGHIIHARWP